MNTMKPFSFMLLEENMIENSVDLKNLRSKCDVIKQKIIKVENTKVDLLILQFISDMKHKHLKEKNNIKLSTSIECYILNLLHDSIVPKFYEMHKDEDEIIFQKCLSLQHVKLAQKYGDIQFPASIVELASLDTHKTVHEKVACITACYDFIFAELKHAMVELIAESGGECKEIPGNIPVVNDADIVQLLAVVILRAKCKHLYSNLYYIQSLGDLHLSDKNCERVLFCFNDAIELLIRLNEDLASTSRKTCSEMNLKQYDNLVRRLDNASIRNGYERLSMTRITTQISKSHEYIGNL